MRVFAAALPVYQWRRAASCARCFDVAGHTLTLPSPLEGEGSLN